MCGRTTTSAAGPGRGPHPRSPLQPGLVQGESKMPSAPAAPGAPDPTSFPTLPPRASPRTDELPRSAPALLADVNQELTNGRQRMVRRVHATVGIRARQAGRDRNKRPRSRVCSAPRAEGLIWPLRRGRSWPGSCLWHFGPAASAPAERASEVGWRLSGTHSGVAMGTWRSLEGCGITASRGWRRRRQGCWRWCDWRSGARGWQARSRRDR